MYEIFPFDQAHSVVRNKLLLEAGGGGGSTFHIEYAILLDNIIGGIPPPFYPDPPTIPPPSTKSAVAMGTMHVNIVNLIHFQTFFYTNTIFLP